MKAMFNIFRRGIYAGLVLTAISAHGFGRTVNLQLPIAPDGICGLRFGKTAEVMLGKPFLPSLDPGPHGEQFIFKGIKDPRFGFDSLHLGFTMESQRLCSLSLIRNFNYAESDDAMLGMASNVYGWIVASFDEAVVANGEFNLHSPPHALYASMETDTTELRLEVSRRHDVAMGWLMLTMLDKRLIDEASVEYRRLSSDETVKAEVESRKMRFRWLLPLLYAVPLYLVCCLPVFLLVLAAYLIVMKLRKREPIRALLLCDPLSLVLSPYIWACLEGVGQTKSLSNIIEFAIIGWTWCLILAVRYILSAIGNRRCERFYGIATLVILSAVSGLLAVFCPALPE